MPMSTSEYISHFLAVSYLYFQLTDKALDNLTAEDMEDLLEIINAGNSPTSCPDQHVV